MDSVLTSSGKVQFKEINYNTTFLDKRGWGPTRMQIARPHNHVDSGHVIRDEGTVDNFLGTVKNSMFTKQRAAASFDVARSEKRDRDPYIEGIELVKNIGFKEELEVDQRPLDRNVYVGAITNVASVDRVKPGRTLDDAVSAIEFRKVSTACTQEHSIKDGVKYTHELLPDALLDEILVTGQIDRGLKTHVKNNVENPRDYGKARALAAMNPSIKVATRVESSGTPKFRKIAPTTTRENPLVDRPKIVTRGSVHAPIAPALPMMTQRAYKRIDTQTLNYPDPEVMKARITVDEIFRGI